MNHLDLRWNEIPYAGEKKPPSNSEEMLATSLATHYLKMNGNDNFITNQGENIQFDIRSPHKINWEKELKFVQKTIKEIKPHQKELATYWGTGFPTKYFTPLMETLMGSYKVSTPIAAKIYAAVLAAINDSFVVTWHLKFKYLVPRPIQLDHNLTTILDTPRHPSYPSGHATIAGCTETVLNYYFPNEAKRLRILAKECAASRLYAGVHFPIDNEEGLRLGRQIGRIAVHELKKEPL